MSNKNNYLIFIMEGKCRPQSEIHSGVFVKMVAGFCITLHCVLWERDHLVVLVKVIMSEMRADLSLPINFYDHYARIAETSSLIDRKWLSLH